MGGGDGVLSEQGVHGHDEARRAEAALRAVHVRQPLLRARRDEGGGSERDRR